MKFANLASRRRRGRCHRRAGDRRPRRRHQHVGLGRPCQHRPTTASTPSADFSSPVTVDLALLPTTAPAGLPGPGGSAQLQLDLTIDNGTAAGFSAASVSRAPSPTTSAPPSAPRSRRRRWSGPYPPPRATDTRRSRARVPTRRSCCPRRHLHGDHAQAVHADRPPTASGATVATATCTTRRRRRSAPITLSKQARSLKAKGPKSAKKGAVVTVKGKVTNDYVQDRRPGPTGKLIVKDGKKKVGKGKLKKGKSRSRSRASRSAATSWSSSTRATTTPTRARARSVKVTIKADA